MNKEFVHGYPFYTFQAPENLVNRVLERIQKELTFKKIGVDDNKTTSFYGYTETEDYFSCFYDEELYNYLNNCIDPVFAEHFTYGNKSKVVDLWATKTNFTASSEYHRHHFSIFSGLLYLQDSSTSTSFIFEDKFEEYWSKFMPVKHQKLEWKSESKKGKIIIWPSFIKHRILPNRDKLTRYTLAFNTFWDSTVSNTPTCLLQLNTVQANEIAILTDKKK